MPAAVEELGGAIGAAANHQCKSSNHEHDACGTL